ncbi:MAG: glucose-1-phosphate adenylyltransferase, partial [Firmicutes bacterium]|nr:glucose-1-phosphate adenylyltransferase [Bacillota bacterium]
PDQGSDVRVLAMIVNRKFLLDLIDTFAAMDFEDLLNVVSSRLSAINVDCYEYGGYVGIIETLNDYMACSRDLLDADIRAELFDSERTIFTKPQDRTPTIYKSGSHVKNSLVAAGCVIEGTVENSIISRNTRIGKGAVVKDAVLMQKCVVEDGAQIRNMICDKLVRIGKNVRLEGGDDKPLVLGKETRV